MAEKIEVKGRIQKDLWGYLFFETDPPKWKFKEMSEKLAKAGYVAGQEIKLTLEPVEVKTK